ncbi:MAG TPA: hypothetical protein DC046_12485 [Rhodospirillaceae bacterium]|nr:hypothetical protein [Rhodospirillaceae bacterium]
MENEHQRIVDEFDKNLTFAALKPETLEALASVSKTVSFAPGQFVFREGDLGTTLYLLLSGSAAVVRELADKSLVELSTVSAGELLGELVFLDGGERSASLRAETPCEFILIPAGALVTLPGGDGFISDLKGALASVVAERARTMSDDMVASLQRQLEITKLQNQFGHFLVFTIAIFLISTMLFYLVAEDYVQDVYDPGFSWQTVLFLAVPCLLVIKVMKIPLADLGIKREGAWRSFRDTMGICILLTIPAAIYLVWFKEPSAGKDMGVTIDPYFLVQYFAHSLFQEVGSRGLIQGLFQKFLDDAKGHRSIFLTSTVFASLHITFGIDAVVITFFASFIFGYLYLKQKNLVGVTILHYWLGVLAAFMVAF